MAVMALAASAVAIWGSALGCKVACCGKPTTGVCLNICYNYTYQVHVSCGRTCRKYPRWQVYGQAGMAVREEADRSFSCAIETSLESI